MARVAKLSVDLEANSSSLTSALARADRAMASSGARWNRTLATLDRGFQQLSMRAGGAMGSLMSLQGGIGVLLGGTGLLALTKGALDTADAIGKMADRLGLSTDAVQAYQHAAGLAGATSEQFEQAVRRLNQRIGEGKLPYKDTETALRAIADRIQAAGSAAERARIANEAFGGSGQQLIPMLQNGAAGLDAARREAERLGLILDEKTIRSAEALNDELSRMMSVAQRNFQQGLLGGLVRDSEGLRGVYADPAFQQGLRAFGQFVGETLGFVVRNASTIITVMRALAAVYVGMKVGGAVAGRRGAVIGGVAGAGVVGLFELLRDGADDVEDAVGRINSALGNVGQGLEEGGGGPAGRDPLEAIRRSISDTRFEAELLRADLTPLGQQFYRTLRQAGIDTSNLGSVTGETFRVVRELAIAYGELQAAQEAQGAAGEEASRRQALALQSYAETARDAFGEADRFASRSVQGVEDAILSMAKSGEDAVRKMVDGIIEDLARLMVRQHITGPLANALGNAIGGLFGPSTPTPQPAVGVGLGSIQVESLPPIPRATGGPVEAGKLYQVGERGVEWFVPDTSGTIIPNHQIGGGGVTVQQHIAVDARGADPGAHTRIAAAVEVAVARSKAEIFDAINRGGNAAKITGRRR